MPDLFDNSSAARAASLFSRGQRPDDDDVPGVFTMTLRFPITVAATIATMAEHAGRSRNEMANLIVEAGITAIYRETPVEIQAEIAQDIQDNLSDFLS
jgi:hypothetical protein